MKIEITPDHLLECFIKIESSNTPEDNVEIEHPIDVQYIKDHPFSNLNLWLGPNKLYFKKENDRWVLVSDIKIVNKYITEE